MYHVPYAHVNLAVLLTVLQHKEELVTKRKDSQVSGDDRWHAICFLTLLYYSFEEIVEELRRKQAMEVKEKIFVFRTDSFPNVMTIPVPYALQVLVGRLTSDQTSTHIFVF